MPRLRTGGALAALLVLVLSGTASATTFRFPAAADTSVSAAAPSDAYGTSTALRVDGDPLRRAYLRFNVSGLDGPVSRATLTMWSWSSTAMGITAHAVASTSWSEAGMTWWTQPGLGARAGASGPFSAGAMMGVDVTPLVAGNGTIAVGLATTSTASKTFDSREAGRQVPTLVIETSPGSAPAPSSPSGSDVVIAAAGDIACDPGSGDFNGGFGQAWACRQRATSDMLLARRPAAVLPLGDTQYESGALWAFSGSYDPSWGRLRSITRPVVGNHEYGTPGAAGYFDYFGWAAGDRSRGYYSYDLGAWHLVALNSNCWAVGGCWAGSPQERWLRADLAASSRSCVLAYWHHPTFTSAERGGAWETRPLWQALDEDGADVALTGHEHLYERFARQDATGRADVDGIRQFVVGTGGKSLYGAPSTRAPNSLVLDAGHFGVAFLTLRAGTYDWQYQTIDGAVRDSGSGTC